MTEYRIVWQACPHVQHPTRVFFVRAQSAEAARSLAQDHIERSTGIEWFSIHSVQEYIRPIGQVLNLKD